jgi:hypothetical protein
VIEVAFLVLMNPQARTTPTTPSSEATSTDQVIYPPNKIKLEAVSAERTIAAFMDLCVRPRWDKNKVEAALKKSDFQFENVSDPKYPTSFRWQGKRVALGVDIGMAGAIQSQCELSMGSVQPRTGAQFLAMLKPALEAELGHDVRINDKGLTLEWDPPDWSFVDRVSIAEPESTPSQSVWLIFDEVPRGMTERSNGE